MSLRLEPVLVATGSEDEEGQLVFHSDYLVAVLVRLSNEHEDELGRWFVEASFGPVAHREAPTFADTDEARVWIASRLT